MHKLLPVAAAATAILASPASAAEIWLDSDHTIYTNGQTTNGSFTFAGGGVTVTASAWSMGSDGLEDERLGIWDPGLGVWRDTGGDEHVTDNNGDDEFILLTFDKLVTLDYAQLTLGYDDLRDSDLTIGFSTRVLPLANFDEQSNSYLTSGAGLGFTTYNIDGGNSSGITTVTRDISPPNTSYTGNIWLIGGRFGGSDQDDGFKLEKLGFTVVPSVPEPATWLMMILGFGMVGGLMRAQRRQKLAVSYS